MIYIFFAPFFETFLSFPWGWLYGASRHNSIIGGYIYKFPNILLSVIMYNLLTQPQHPGRAIDLTNTICVEKSTRLYTNIKPLADLLYMNYFLFALINDIHIY